MPSSGRLYDAPVGHTGTRRVLAVVAALREVNRLGVRELADLEGLHAVEEGAARIGAGGPLVAHRPGRAGGVPLLAAGHAGVAADADVQVDDERELLAALGLAPPSSPPPLPASSPGRSAIPG